MQLAETSIRRPVFATVLSLLIVLIGAVSFNRLTVREYPKIDEPVVTVSVRYAGASAEVIESQVTKPLEDSIAGIDGVDVITSISRAEQGQITVRFRLEKDADSAAAEVRDRTSRVRNRLPQAIDEPVIAKVEADAFPVIFLTFSSETLSALQINDLINRVVKSRLQTVTGVADVRIFGERKYAMRVWLDTDKLASYRLTTQDVEDAIRRSNLELPAGRIESQQREFSVTSQTDLMRPAQFGDIVVKNVNGFTVKVRDVARVQEAAAEERTAVRLNGRAAVAVGVIRQATANPLDLSKGVREAIPKLSADLPPGMQIDIANDNSIFIDRSVKNVYKTIVEAVILVALVIFVFLRTARASLIPIITIPVSLVGTFALMALAGFSINTLTLLALVLAIGLVVDDAIVMLENIFRHIEEGMDPFSASIRGAREIGFAVVTMTATLVAVYAPLAFTPGRTGRLFVEFALHALAMLTVLALLLIMRQLHAADGERVQERRRLESQIGTRTSELRELAGHLVDAREDERGRVARELHDEMGGLFTAMKLEFSRLRRVPDMPAAAHARLAGIESRLNNGIALKRRIVENLRPTSLDQLGLCAALEMLCTDTAANLGIAMHHNLQPVPLSKEAELTVYRLVQEALTNISKYAQARVVNVSLAGAGGPPNGMATVSVQDDGRGFNLATVRAAQHGLLGMRVRVESHAGILMIDSSPGGGTRITAQLPTAGLPMPRHD